MSYRRKSDPFKVGKVYEVEYTFGHRGTRYLLSPLELQEYDVKVMIIANYDRGRSLRTDRDHIRTTIPRHYLRMVQGVTAEDLPLYVGWACYGSFTELLRGGMPHVPLKVNQHVNVRLFQPEDLGRTPAEMM